LETDSGGECNSELQCPEIIKVGNCRIFPTTSCVLIHLSHVPANVFPGRQMFLFVKLEKLGEIFFKTNDSFPIHTAAGSNNLSIRAQIGGGALNLKNTSAGALLQTSHGGLILADTPLPFKGRGREKGSDG